MSEVLLFSVSGSCLMQGWGASFSLTAPLPPFEPDPELADGCWLELGALESPLRGEPFGLSPLSSSLPEPGFAGTVGSSHCN